MDVSGIVLIARGIILIPYNVAIFSCYNCVHTIIKNHFHSKTEHLDTWLGYYIFNLWTNVIGIFPSKHCNSHSNTIMGGDNYSQLVLLFNHFEGFAEANENAKNKYKYQFISHDIST